jgi:hypothetical protein
MSFVIQLIVIESSFASPSVPRESFMPHLFEGPSESPPLTPFWNRPFAQRIRPSIDDHVSKEPGPP